jgi:hypothetical protein
MFFPLERVVPMKDGEGRTARTRTYGPRGPYRPQEKGVLLSHAESVRLSAATPEGREKIIAKYLKKLKRAR